MGFFGWYQIMDQIWPCCGAIVIEPPDRLSRVAFEGNPGFPRRDFTEEKVFWNI